MSNGTQWGQSSGWPQPPVGAPQYQAPSQQPWPQAQWPAQQWPTQAQMPAQPQQPWPPQPGYAPGGFPSAPVPRRLPLGRLLMFGLFAVLALVAILSLFGALAGGGGNNSVPPGNYQNEDYKVPSVDLNPPALPMPETVEKAKQLMAANAVYNQEVARPVRCEMGEINPNAVSNDQLEAHLDKLMVCLMRVWGPTLDKAGWKAVRPSVTVYSSPVKSRCGDTQMTNASYCGADQQVYVASDVLRIIPSKLRDGRYLIETVLAHEFGHAIQARTGILISEAALEQRASSKAAANDLSRRIETQADCLAGQFLSSVAQSTNMTQPDLTTIAELAYSIGDDVLSGKQNIDGNHGLGQSRKYWIELGMASTPVGSCNTFVAPDNLVR